MNKQDPSTLSEEISALQEEKGMIRISEELVNNSQDISKNHKDGLELLPEQTYSHPLKQTSRNNQKPTYRIFYVKNIDEHQPSSFQAMTKQLQNQLIQERSSVEGDKYISKLRTQYGVQNQSILVPETFNPFSLK